MKKLTYSLAIALFFLFCSSCKTEKKVKSYTTTEFSTKQQSGELKKDTIIVEYSTGVYQSGQQSYFVGLKGYNNHDTTKFPDKKDNTKKDGNNTFYYDERGKMIFATIKKGDTTWNYEDDLEMPIGFSVTDSQGHVFKEGDLIFNRLLNYKDSRYDEYGNLVYAIIEREYLPSSFDLKLYSEIQLSKKKAEERRTMIREIRYVYY